VFRGRLDGGRSRDDRCTDDSAGSEVLDCSSVSATSPWCVQAGASGARIIDCSNVTPNGQERIAESGEVMRSAIAISRYLALSEKRRIPMLPSTAEESWLQTLDDANDNLRGLTGRETRPRGALGWQRC